MYNLSNIHTASSYESLKRNGFTDAQAVAYYELSKELRTSLFMTIKGGKAPTKSIAKPIAKPIAKIENRGTQMCTNNLFSQVNAEFKKQMNATFLVNGVSYNMVEIGYTFGWNTNRSRAGVHKIRRSRFAGIISQRIELSRWVLENSDKTYDQWVNTILHEIAHAIDHARRGTSDHSPRWRFVAHAIGCSGERCYTAKVDAKASKYTVKCSSCGKERASHKRSRIIERGNRSCGTCAPGRYDARYNLIQIQNY